MTIQLKIIVSINVLYVVDVVVVIVVLVVQIGID